jgi:hypothetical protein
MSDNVKMNPPNLAPLRPVGPQKPPGAAPPGLSAPRPMPPAPPKPLDAAKARGILSPMSPVARPKSPHAMTLEQMAAMPKTKPRLCNGCGGSQRVNVIKDKKGKIVGYSPCPVCVEL